MINNVIKRAEIKLAEHRMLGKKSNLSIFEVAQLMDLINTGKNLKKSFNQSLFFSYSAN